MAAPLARTNEIVILSGEGSRVTGELNRLLAELPVSVNALTGVDLTKVSVSPCSIGSHSILFNWSSSPLTVPQIPLLQKMVGQTAIWWLRPQTLQRVSASSMTDVVLFYFSLLANFSCPRTLDSNQVFFSKNIFLMFPIFLTETNLGYLPQGCVDPL